MTVLGLIPARGGSRRVPRKNIRRLGGKPLIAWTIEAARRAVLIDYVAVSSEDEEILRVAEDWGADPLKRPPEMATDDISPYPAILHALSHFGVTHLCLLQPTSPFRTAEDIDEGIRRCLIEGGPIASAETGSTVPNGAVYVARIGWLQDGRNFDMSDVGRFHMPANRSLDIDTEEDWKAAERLLTSAIAA